MDKEDLYYLFKDFLTNHVDELIVSWGIMTGNEWIKERKSTYALYRDKFIPEKIDNLTKGDFSYFLTFKGNKSWTNLQRGCKRLTEDMKSLKKVLVFLQNESIPIEERLNLVTRGGKSYIKGFGKNIATGLLHLFNWQKHGVWNNLSQKVLSELNRLPYISSNFGQSYIRLNSELQKLAEDLNTDLVYIDGFLWWLDYSNKIKKPLKKTNVSLEKTFIKFYMPTIKDLEIARKTFERYEPRDLFYRVATELVDLAMQKKTSLNVTEALAVLLQTWNKAFYRYKPFNNQHFSDIESIVNSHYQDLAIFRQRSIESFCDEDETVVKKVFMSFEKILGPVGTAKSLHLLAPRFFPLWDRAIARAYRLSLMQQGKNAEQYCHFIKITKEQCKKLGGEKALGRNPLKALDEYNYCNHTKGWIKHISNHS